MIQLGILLFFLLFLARTLGVRVGKSLIKRRTNKVYDHGYRSKHLRLIFRTTIPTYRELLLNQPNLNLAQYRTTISLIPNYIPAYGSTSLFHFFVKNSKNIAGKKDAGANTKTRAQQRQKANNQVG